MSGPMVEAPGTRTAIGCSMPGPLTIAWSGPLARAAAAEIRMSAQAAAIRTPALVRARAMRP